MKCDTIVLKEKPTVTDVDGAGKQFPQTAIFSQRGGVIGWKSRRVQIAVEFHTGVSPLNRTDRKVTVRRNTSVNR